MRGEIIEVISDLLSWMTVGYGAYLVLYSTFLFVAVLISSSILYSRNKKVRFQNVTDHKYHIPVTIVVPAYNEEVTVVETVKSLLMLDYQSYEIIVVDDGSKDRTTAVLREAFDMRRVRRPIRKQVPCRDAEAIYECFTEKVPLVLVRKINGGKADALNMGINAARFPYFICMDADSVLQVD